MLQLIETAKEAIQKRTHLPFSVYCASQEQHILNVPIIKPLLILILSGRKMLGEQSQILCPASSFVFLSNSPNMAIRNIPSDAEYFALLIEFEYSDFDSLQGTHTKTDPYFQGEITPQLHYTVQQFIEWTAIAPAELWYLRRQEILLLLASSGFEQVFSIMEPPTLTHKVYNLINSNMMDNLDGRALSSMLAMSESTLRRKLMAEGSSLQAIKDQAKLGYGLHLVQTTFDSIGLIAEQCGYSSHSRFTEKFKQLFAVTPAELRKARVHDLGE